MEKCNETFVVNLNLIFRNEWMRSFWQPYFKLFVKSDVLIFVFWRVTLHRWSAWFSCLLRLIWSRGSYCCQPLRSQRCEDWWEKEKHRHKDTMEQEQQGQQEHQRLPGLVTQFVTLPLRSEPMQRDQHTSVTRADAHGNIPSTVLGTVGFCFTTSSVEAIHQPSRAWSGKKQYRSYKHVVQLTQSQRDRGERRKEK